MKARVLLAATLLIPMASAQSGYSERVEMHTAAGPVAAAWAILHAGMGDSNENHRRQAALAVGAIGPQPQALKLMEGALHDKSTIVRQTAVAGLGEMKAQETIP